MAEIKSHATITDQSGNRMPVLVQSNTGNKIFVQSTDPAASATDGDIWIQTT